MTEASAPEKSEFEAWAEREVQLAGLLDPDSDYEGMIGTAVLGLVSHFAGQGHSGFSAPYTASVFMRLVEHKPLTPITNDPLEWQVVTWDDDGCLWQSRRMSSAFSLDQGHTYYDIDEKMPRWRNLADKLQRTWLFNHWFKPWRFQKRHKAQHAE